MNLRRPALRIGAALAAVVAAATGCVASPPAEIIGAVTPEDAISASLDSVVRIRSLGPCGTGVGSGFVVEGGRIVTNHHVVEGAHQVQVETWDGERVPTGDVRVGVGTDLAVIGLRPAGRRMVDPLPLADEEPTPGAILTAIGYAGAGPAVTTQGQFIDLPRGRRFGEPGKVLRMSASVRPGNSGGPALDEEARVVAVVYAYEVATLRALAVPGVRLRAVLDDPARTAPLQPC